MAINKIDIEQNERLGAMEIKMKYFEKLLYLTLIGIAGQYGIELLPL